LCVRDSLDAGQREEQGNANFVLFHPRGSFFRSAVRSARHQAVSICATGKNRLAHRVEWYGRGRQFVKWADP
jgi:hypothetical protein